MQQHMFSLSLTCVDLLIVEIEEPLASSYRQRPCVFYQSTGTVPCCTHLVCFPTHTVDQRMPGCCYSGETIVNRTKHCQKKNRQICSFLCAPQVLFTMVPRNIKSEALRQRILTERPILSTTTNNRFRLERFPISSNILLYSIIR